MGAPHCASPLLAEDDSPTHREPMVSAPWRRPEVAVALVFSLCVVLTLLGRSLTGHAWQTQRTSASAAAVGATQRQQQQRPAGLPAPQAAASKVGVVGSIEEWQQSPGSVYRTPQSACSLHPDGVVAPAPRPPPAAPPFLFDLRQEVLPSKRRTCSHCPTADDGCTLEALPQLCCGVCQFEHRFCYSHYPGRNLSEQAAAQFAAAGHRLQDFSPCELFQRIRGRTLWLLGDSQTWHFYYALECFLREFAPSLRRTDPLPSRRLVDLLTLAELKRCYKPYPVPPVCLELAQGTRVCVVRVDYARELQEVVLPTLRQHSPGFQQDLVVMNAGLHYYEDVMCTDDDCQVLGPDSKYVRELRRLARWRARNRASLPQTVWMDTPPQHFPGTGYWTGSFRAKSCEPLAAWQRGEATARAGGTWNAAAARLVPRLADAHLATWEASVGLWDSHMPGECTHWCQPGAYQIWLYLLNGVLRDHALGNPAAVQQQRQRQ